MSERDARLARLADWTHTPMNQLAEDIPAELEASAQDQKDLAEAQEDLKDLMAYVDEAKIAAQAKGRITGEPLADFINRMEISYE